MKKLSLFSLVLLCAMFSCKKSDSGSSYHITATIGGKSKNFNATPPIATNSTPGGLSTISITGILNPGTGESMMITLYRTSNAAFTPGTYTDTTAEVRMQAVYTVNLGTQYYAGTAMAGRAEAAGITLKNHFKIVISSLDAKSIKGTFSGDLFPDTDISATPMPMVNGDFNVQIKQ